MGITCTPGWNQYLHQGVIWVSHVMDGTATSV